MEKLFLIPFEDKHIELFHTWILEPHVSKWYHHTDAWMNEVTHRDEFPFIHHFIVMCDTKPIGFCQYYDYKLGGEIWHDGTDIENTYSIDYLIGEMQYRGMHLASELITLLETEIMKQPNVEKIIVQPEPETIISRKTLVSAGYGYDKDKNLFVKIVQMKNLTVACAEDADRVKAFYRTVCEKTSNMDVYGRWMYGLHPTDAIIDDFIRKKELYLFESDGLLVGAVALTSYQTEEYHFVSWGKDLQDTEVGVLHLLAVHPDFQREGIAGQIVEECISICRKCGMKAVRLDALCCNTPAHHLYESIGFTYRGKQNLFACNTGNIDFFYYEKLLSE